MKQNARTFIHDSLSSLAEQQLLFLFSTLFGKARKLKFGFFASSITVVSEYAKVVCACVTKQCLSRLRRMRVAADA
jgi:hypothetical protein